MHLMPYWPSGPVKQGELWGFLGGVVDGKNALREGQFPLRVAPTQANGDRYPVYQFYANLPFTLPALIHALLEKNPYAAWKYAMFATLAMGGWWMYRLAKRWSRSRLAGLVAAGVFLSAPYVFTDLHDRGAMAELTALCLLPLALHTTWGCFTRPGAWRIAVCAVAWAAIGLSHNITYLYGIVFTALFIASYLRFHERVSGRVGRLLLAGGLHALLMAWFIAPQFAVMKDLDISTSLTATPWGSRDLVPLGILLSPICATPIISTVPRLGLQVGWAVLAGVLASIAAMVFVRVRPRTGLSGTLRARRFLIARLIVLWLIAFFIAWQPINFWPLLPRAFYFVQFSYRVLGFTTIFGALLAALAVGPLFRCWPLRRNVARTTFVAIAIAITATCLNYFPAFERHPVGAWRWIVNKPQLGGLENYLLSERRPSAIRRLNAQTLAAEQTRLMRSKDNATRFDISVAEPTRAILPVYWYPGLLRVTIDGVKSEYGVEGRYTVVDLPAGQHDVRVWFTGLTWANVTSLIGLGIAALMIAIKKRMRRRPVVQ